MSTVSVAVGSILTEGASVGSITTGSLALLLLPLGAAGKALITRGRRHALIPAPSVPSPGPLLLPGPFVLYLRAFGRDARFASAQASVGVRGPWNSEEEQIVHALRPLGEVYAVGAPGESLPPLGASRVYLPPDEGDTGWQARVREMMVDASLVVVMLDATDGVYWELRTLVATVDPTRVVLMVPFDEEFYAGFAAALDVLPQGLPAYPEGKRLVELGVRAAIHFDSDWTSHIVRFDHDRAYDIGRYGAFWGPLEAAVAHELAPALVPLGLPMPKITSRWTSAGPKLSHRQNALRRRIGRGLAVVVLVMLVVVAVLALLSV